MQEVQLKIKIIKNPTTVCFSLGKKGETVSGVVLKFFNDFNF